MPKRFYQTILDQGLRKVPLHFILPFQKFSINEKSMVSHLTKLQ